MYSILAIFIKTQYTLYMTIHYDVEAILAVLCVNGIRFDM